MTMALQGIETPFVSATSADPTVFQYDNFDRGNTWVGVSNGVASLHQTAFPLSMSLNTVGLLVSMRANTQAAAGATISWWWALASTQTAVVTNISAYQPAIEGSAVLTIPNSQTSALWLTAQVSSSSLFSTGTWAMYNNFSTSVKTASISVWGNTSINPANNNPVSASFYYNTTLSAFNAVFFNSVVTSGSSAVRQPYVIMTA